MNLIDGIIQRYERTAVTNSGDNFFFPEKHYGYLRKSGR